jgi:2-dehydro-3-deoxyphosphogalactonate aldolase
MPNNFKSLSSVLPINTFSLAVGGVDVPNFKEWLDVGISGFGLGSNLYKQGMMLDEVKENAELIVKSYDNAILEY